MINTVFTKYADKRDMGTSGKSMKETWKVVDHLGDGVYSCVRVDSTYDPMAAASPKKRTFKEEDIINYVNSRNSGN